jgi:type I restriction enzyme S subunit
MPEMRTLPFSKAMSDLTGGQPKVQRRDYLPHGDLPIIDQGQADIAGYSNDPSLAFRGDLPVILFGDHTRSFKYVDFPFALGADGVKVLKPSAQFDPQFIYHFLRSLKLPSLGYSRHFKLLREVSIPWRPISEQRRIVDLLNHANNIRRLRREAQEKARQVIPALFVEMFGDPGANPNEWPVLPLIDLVRVGDTINYGVVQPGEEVPDGVPIVRVGDFEGGRIRAGGLKRISRNIEGAYERSRLHGDEVLIACVGSIGAVALVDETLKGANIVRAVARVRIGRSVNRLFLAAYLQTPFVQTFFHSETRTVAQPTLNIRQIKETPVLVPPLELQEAFAERVSDLQSIIAQQDRMAAASEQMADALMAKLFNGGAADATKTGNGSQDNERRLLVGLRSP